MLQTAYHRYLRDQFALAFDVFLAIRREVDAGLKTLLKRADPDWRVKNACPACRYKVCLFLHCRRCCLPGAQLQDEPELVIPGLFAVDGNFSLKRSAAAGTADPRELVSDYKIDDAKIDLYANEVAKRTRVTPANDVRSMSLTLDSY